MLSDRACGEAYREYQTVDVLKALLAHHHGVLAPALLAFAVSLLLGNSFRRHGRSIRQYTGGGLELLLESQAIQPEERRWPLYALGG